MSRRFGTLCLIFVFAVGCGDTGEATGPEGEEGPHTVPNFDFGKADNYIGTNSREFVLTLESSAELPADFSQADADRQDEIISEVVADKMQSIGYSIERHVKDVIREHNSELTEDQKEFFVYFRSDNAEAGADISVEQSEVAFSVEMEFVGSVYMMSILAPPDSSRRTFDVDVYSSRWGGSVEDTIEVEIRGSDSRDAFPRYDALFEDGLLDIAIHYGGDYNDDRYDLETARWTAESLLEDGWTHESVSSFEELRIDSGPFVRQVTVEGRDVQVRMSLYHSEMKDDEVGGERVGQQGLRAAVERSLLEADIFVYSGHAGTDAGFILDYSPRFEIPATEFEDMQMADKYQVFVMDGCNTYRTYVRDIMANSARDFANTDIMTTVHTTPFSAGYYVLWRLMYWFTYTDSKGSHFPMSWKTIIRGLNQEFDDVHYGVHGVDDGPKLNPHASDGFMCQSCTSDADCGAGGNYCLGFGDGGGCGVGCTTDTACGDGFRCARVFDADDYYYLPKQCVPVTMSCGG